MSRYAVTLVLVSALASTEVGATPRALTDDTANTNTNTPALAAVAATSPSREPFLAPPVAPAAPSLALKATFWGGAAAGGVLLALGAVFGVLSETHAAAANERFDTRTLTAADQARYDAARLDAKIANVSFGTGAAALVAAAVAYLVDPAVAGDEASTAGASP